MNLLRPASFCGGSGFISVAGPQHVVNLVGLLKDEEVDELIRDAVWHFQADVSAFFGLRLRLLIPTKRVSTYACPGKTREQTNTTNTTNTNTTNAAITANTVNRTNAVRDALTAWSCSDPAPMKAWEMTTKMEGVADEASKMKEVDAGKPEKSGFPKGRFKRVRFTEKTLHPFALQGFGDVRMPIFAQGSSGNPSFPGRGRRVARGDA